MARPHTQTCPVAGALNILGDHWTLLIVREALYGASRFGEFRKNTGIAKNLLAARLNTLVDAGVFERTAFADRGTTHTYKLTQKGHALKAVMFVLTEWGNTHVYGQGAEPVVMIDAASGQPIKGVRPYTAGGLPVDDNAVTFVPGPGASTATLKRLEQARQASAPA